LIIFHMNSLGNPRAALGEIAPLPSVSRPARAEALSHPGLSSLIPQDASSPRSISSGPEFVIDARAQRKLLHACIILVIVKHHLEQIGRIDGTTPDLPGQPLVNPRAALGEIEPLPSRIRPARAEALSHRLLPWVVSRDA